MLSNETREFWLRLWRLLWMSIPEVVDLPRRILVLTNERDWLTGALGAKKDERDRLAKALDAEKDCVEHVTKALQTYRELLEYYEGAVSSPGAKFLYTCNGCLEEFKGAAAPQLQFVEGIGMQVCASCWVKHRKGCPVRNERQALPLRGATA